MLKLENLSITYGERIILDDVSMRFPKGHVSVIQGASGSGKSSLLNVMGLMQQPNKGCRYDNDDVDILAYTEQEKADFRLHNIGFIFQQNNLIQELSAEENVSIPLRVCGTSKGSMTKVKELLDFVGLSHLCQHYPGRLSGGEEQRVAIARALANDANIILADEPTASLDEANTNIILGLLQKLAHELNKTVIIVSHDPTVLSIADFVYKIEDKKLVTVSDRDLRNDHITDNKGESTSEFPKRKMFDFVRFYTKNRIGDKVLNKVFVALTAVIAALAIVFVNFGSEYTKEQSAFINGISDKSIFAVNDTLGLNAKTDYGSALAINDEVLQKIGQIPNVHIWYPYYNFSSTSFFGNDSEVAEIRIKDGDTIVGTKTYERKKSGRFDEEQFMVAPLYPEENLDFLLSDKTDEENGTGVILTYTLAEQLGILPENLVDKEVEMKVFVPTKLRNTKISKSTNSDDPSAEQVELLGDTAAYKLVTIKSKIRGVLSQTYDLQRSEITSAFLLDYDAFNNILMENKDDNYEITFDGSLEKELAPSAVVVFANSYNDVSGVVAKLQSISPIFSISNKATDVRTIQNNIAATKNIMMLITAVFVAVIIVMFSMLYYMKNRSRKKEVGILKSLGLTKQNVVQLITFEMGNIAIRSFVNSLIIALIFSFLGNGLFGIPLFNITLFSVLVGLVISVGIVIVAGVLPIYNASKVDPIAAIREINK